MSIGLYEHPHFGLVRRYIQNNRYVLEAQYNFKDIEGWYNRYEKFLQVYLKGKK
jgi:hypothetical protein